MLITENGPSWKGSRLMGKGLRNRTMWYAARWANGRLQAQEGRTRKERGDRKCFRAQAFKHFEALGVSVSREIRCPQLATWCTEKSVSCRLLFWTRPLNVNSTCVWRDKWRIKWQLWKVFISSIKFLVIFDSILNFLLSA